MTVTVLATPTTKIKRREPLRVLDMAPSQAQARSTSSAAPGGGTGRGRGGRRLSARLSKTDQDQNDENINNAGSKRKAASFDENIEGFKFTRLQTKKSRPSIDAIPEEPNPENPAPRQSGRKGRPPKKKTESKPEVTAEVNQNGTGSPTKRQTRGATKVTATDPEPQPGSDTRSIRKRDHAEPIPEPIQKEKKRRKGRPSKSSTEERNGFVSPEPQQSGTSKIALPVADTPVIQRNKEMRGTTKSGKSRRSSLGMRGRRASSLIDSGASNALPHKEVDTTDLYKHIASDGLPEPRRMRQLLTWCATRAVGDKPKGARPEDASARLAARVIQEELLKDFSTNSELSNWFGREDVNPPSVVVKKPNPKNVQNADKIKELEEQIQRLQRERHSLNALLRPPSIPQAKPPTSKQPSETLPNGRHPSLQPESSSTQSAQSPKPEKIDSSLLDPSQLKILASIDPDAAKKHVNTLSQEEPPVSSEVNTIPPMTPSTVSTRLSRLTTRFAPTLDSFAAGIHDIELYRATSDTVSSRVLRICAERLEERDARNAMRRLAIEGDEEEGKKVRVRYERPREDLGLILGALSRVERR